MNSNLNKKGILKIIQDDKRMMDILEQSKGLDLPDWWIGAGFIRSKVPETGLEPASR